MFNHRGSEEVEGDDEELEIGRVKSPFSNLGGGGRGGAEYAGVS